jgi:hypothetical protein
MTEIRLSVMKAAVRGLALCLTMASAWSSTIEPNPYRSLLIHCKVLDNSFRCARAIEAVQGKGAFRQSFYRMEKTLRVQTAKGVASFVDNEAESDESIHYSFLAYLPSLQLHVLHVQYWEGSNYLVVHHHSGAVASVDGFPNVAPNAQRFISISSAGESGYYPNSVEIWRVTEDALVSEFRDTPSANEWSPEGATWLSSQKLKLRGNCAPSAAKSRICFAQLRRIGDQWRREHDR